MTYAKKVDKNQKEIIQALRNYGADVFLLHMVGKGIPDALVSYNDHTILLEIKDGIDKKLTPDQIKFFANWQGGPLHRVNNVEEAISVLKLYDEQT
jgi:hypothetical protein